MSTTPKKKQSRQSKRPKSSLERQPTRDFHELKLEKREEQQSSPEIKVEEATVELRKEYLVENAFKEIYPELFLAPTISPSTESIVTFQPSPSAREGATDPVADQIKMEMQTLMEAARNTLQKQRKAFKQLQDMELMRIQAAAGQTVEQITLDSSFYEENGLINPIEFFKKKEPIRAPPSIPDTTPIEVPKTIPVSAKVDDKPQAVGSPPKKQLEKTVNNTPSKLVPPSSNVTSTSSPKIKLDKTTSLSSPNKELASSRTQKTVTNRSQKLFQINPEEIKFSEYEANRTYEIPITIKNVSGIGKRMAILPPSLKVFGIKDVKFPGEDGFVSAGMEVSLIIKFSPTSLHPVKDCFHIRSGETEKTAVEIIAQRTPPTLNLPSTLQCGNCLVDAKKQITFECKNKGGAGRCKIVFPENSNDTVFKITPEEFELNPGDSLQLNVSFQPKAQVLYSKVFKVVFENFEQTFNLQGYGALATFGVTSVNNTTLASALDVAELHFGSTTPFASLKKKITIANLAQVPLKYHWDIYGHKDNSVESQFSKLEKIRDSPFSIVPSQGTFEGSKMTFDIEFKPTKISKFNHFARLVVEGLPNSSPISVQRDGISSKEGNENKELINAHLTELVMDGNADYCDVKISPPVLCIPGSITMGQPFNYTVEMTNSSQSDVSFSWGSTDYFTITPSKGVLKANGTLQLQVTLTASESGLFEKQASCILDYALPLCFFVKGKAEGPAVEISDLVVDFGLSKIGTLLSREITLTNKTQIKVPWNLQEQAKSSTPREENGKNVFSISHLQGVLKPKDKQVITIFFRAQTSNTFRTSFLLNLPGNSPKMLTLNAATQAPKVFLTDYLFDIGTSFVGNPVVRKFKMVNPTSFSTYFMWSTQETEDYTLSIKPDRGEVLAKHSVDISLEFLPNKTGSMECIASCSMSDVADPIGLILTTKTEGFSISYMLCNENEQPNQESFVLLDKSNTQIPSPFDFGTLDLLSSTKKILYLKNNSPNQCTCRLNFLKYGITPAEFMNGAPKTAFSDGQSSVSTATALKRGLLSERHEAKKGFQKAKVSDSKHVSKPKPNDVLKDGNGIAFGISVEGEPGCMEGLLYPFAQIKVVLECHNNLFGSFSDILKCEIVGQATFQFPVQVNVVGESLTVVPTTFGMTVKTNEVPQLRWGTLPAQDFPQPRTIKITNSSPLDFSLEWQLFSSTETAEENHVSFGKPFSVEPAKQIIGALSTAEFSITFSSKEAREFNYRLLGVPKIDFTRNKKHQDSAEQLSSLLHNLLVDLSVKNVLPRLITNPTKVKFQYLTTTPGYQCPVQFVNLINNTGAAVSFSLSVEPASFQISLDKNTAPSKLRNPSSTTHELLHQGNLMIGVYFYPDSKNAESIEGKLNINYVNQDTQSIPLVGNLVFPVLSVNPGELDFGEILVGSKKTLTFTLANPSVVDVRWEVMHLPFSPSRALRASIPSPEEGTFDYPAVFSCNITQGMLYGMQNNSHSMVMEVTFKPEHNARYSSRFKISTNNPGPPAEIVLKGVGKMPQST